VVCHLFSLYTQKDVWIKVAVSAQHKKLVRPKQLSTSLEYFSEKRQSIQTHFFFLSVCQCVFKLFLAPAEKICL